MAEEDTVPDIDWGSARMNMAECGRWQRIDLAPLGDDQIVMTITTDVGVYRFTMLRKGIVDLINGLTELDRHMALHDKRRSPVKQLFDPLTRPAWITPSDTRG